MRKREAALQAVTLALALGVGVLVGQTCQGEPEIVTETVTVTKEGPERVVYECPPDAGTPPEPARTVKRRPRQKKAPRALPTASRAVTPKERQQLLGWVRDQSADLEGCRTAGKETFRLAVTLELSDDGAVKKVRLNAPPQELPGQVQQCLRERMARWVPPPELVGGRKELVFGLTI